MAPLRVRGPNGVSTVNVLFDSDTFTVLDFQQELYATTGITPSRQSIKHGYPPQSIPMLVPELPMSSLGLKPGEQVIVSENQATSDRGSSASSAVPPTPLRQQPTAPSAPTPATRATASAPSAPPKKSTTPDAVETDGGFLVHRVVPDDNACLFSSAALIFLQDMTKASRIRELVAEGIKKDPETFNSAILGMEPAKYIETILKPMTWGGSIELGIIATHYKTEISSLDVETGRIDHYAPGGSAALGDMRCVLVYSGIHYDAATLAPMADAPSEWHQTVFPINSTTDASDSVLTAAKKLGDILRAKRAYTNTSTFDLKCEQCGQGLVGEKGARAHAAETGHVKFGEY